MAKPVHVRVSIQLQSDYVNPVEVEVKATIAEPDRVVQEVENAIVRARNDFLRVAETRKTRGLDIVTGEPLPEPIPFSD